VGNDLVQILNDESATDIPISSYDKFDSFPKNAI
jgi:hypothetical protein